MPSVFPFNAPRCGRCSTRYCDKQCQARHWNAESGAHKRRCGKIERAGGAEASYAKRNMADAMVRAMKACKDDVAGEACYICKVSDKYLLRGCACRGTMGAVHLACLSKMATLANEDDPYHAGPKESLWSKWSRWHTCGLCKQSYHGEVRCALGWTCWGIYMQRPQGDNLRNAAMRVLGDGLQSCGRTEEALAAYRAHLADSRRFNFPNLEDDRAKKQLIVTTQLEISVCLNDLGQDAKALRMQRAIYDECMVMFGAESPETLHSFASVVNSLVRVGHFTEARTLAWCLVKGCELSTVVNFIDIYIRIATSFAIALWKDPSSPARWDGASPAEDAAARLDVTYVHSRRVLGPTHPLTRKVREAFKECIAANVSCTYSMRTSRAILDDIKNLS